MYSKKKFLFTGLQGGEKYWFGLVNGPSNNNNYAQGLSTIHLNPNGTVIVGGHYYVGTNTQHGFVGKLDKSGNFIHLSRKSTSSSSSSTATSAPSSIDGFKDGGNDVALLVGSPARLDESLDVTRHNKAIASTATQRSSFAMRVTDTGHYYVVSGIFFTNESNRANVTLFDPNGNQVWTKYFGSTSSISTTASLNMFAGMRAEVDHEGNLILQAQSANDSIRQPLIVKFSKTSGAVMWQRSVAVQGSHEVGGFTVGPDGKTYISFSNYVTRTERWSSHIFCLNTDGNLHWSVQLSNPNSASSSYRGALRMAPDNSVLYASIGYMFYKFSPTDGSIIGGISVTAASQDFRVTDKAIYSICSNIVVSGNYRHGAYFKIPLAEKSGSVTLSGYTFSYNSNAETILIATSSAYAAGETTLPTGTDTTWWGTGYGLFNSTTELVTIKGEF